LHHFNYVMTMNATKMQLMTSSATSFPLVTVLSPITVHLIRWGESFNLWNIIKFITHILTVWKIILISWVLALQAVLEKIIKLL